MDDLAGLAAAAATCVFKVRGVIRGVFDAGYASGGVAGQDCFELGVVNNFR
jgi:hypothetical protein